MAAPLAGRHRAGRGRERQRKRGLRGLLLGHRLRQRHAHAGRLDAVMHMGAARLIVFGARCEGDMLVAGSGGLIPKSKPWLSSG